MKEYSVMYKKHFIICILFFAILAPVAAENMPVALGNTSEQTENTPKYYVSGQNVRIQNGSGQMLEVYNVLGVRILSFRIDSEDKTINLNLPKGIYILKLGKFVRKISLS